LNAIDRIAKPNYIPTVDDVLHSRVRTVGIVEADFMIDGYKFNMVDVGGQRNERRKWIHCFDDVTAVIFVTSLSEYDQKLAEDESTNRMDESIALFAEIANCRYFKNTPLIIFFNKEDLFTEKIKKVDLKVCFPEYKGK
jgi:signal recognition particle receptor subunit beta